MTRARVEVAVMLITPEGIEATSLRRAVEAAAEVFGRSVVVQARAKASVVDARRVAVLVAEAARACGVPFVVNGDVGLARELAADGVHAPSGMPAGGLRAALGGLWLSRAAHAAEDVRAAAANSLDAVLVSPIYPVPGKGPARGLEALREARAIASESDAGGALGGRLRVLALGGVTPERAAACVRAGADGVAVMRAAFAAPSRRGLFEELRAALREAPVRGNATASSMLTYDDTLAKTIELLRRHVSAARSVSPGDHIMNDLGLDSLAVMELIADAEERFDVSMPSEMLAGLGTVDDVAKAVLKLSRPE
ncbi:MAG: thiamine phosphate synthase [Myxococcales bacterium]|jgi:acyl carrier protein|nr:thiamine phosphate synthase [Myxococcales bacterium]MBL0197297.1 thiamine phosphate synthase [Myxococcales bacterium]HQY64410.1 thiamine phosphate synthase [Polyangiaceae bacterium]